MGIGLISMGIMLSISSVHPSQRLMAVYSSASVSSHLLIWKIQGVWTYKLVPSACSKLQQRQTTLTLPIRLEKVVLVLFTRGRGSILQMFEIKKEGKNMGMPAFYRCLEDKYPNVVVKILQDKEGCSGTGQGQGSQKAAAVAALSSILTAEKMQSPDSTPTNGRSTLQSDFSTNIKKKYFLYFNIVMIENCPIMSV